MIHEEIRRFTIVGIIGDNIVTEREKWERRVEADMRDNGCVPLFDVLPAWSTTLRYDNNFDFKLTMHGIYVGEEAWQISGIQDGKVLPMPQRKSKSRSGKSE